MDDSDSDSGSGSASEGESAMHAEGVISEWKTRAEAVVCGPRTYVPMRELLRSAADRMRDSRSSTRGEIANEIAAEMLAKMAEMRIADGDRARIRTWWRTMAERAASYYAHEWASIEREATRSTRAQHKPGLVGAFLGKLVEVLRASDRALADYDKQVLEAERKNRPLGTTRPLPVETDGEAALRCMIRPLVVADSRREYGVMAIVAVHMALAADAKADALAIQSATDPDALKSGVRIAVAAASPPALPPRARVAPLPPAHAHPSAATRAIIDSFYSGGHDPVVAAMAAGRRVAGAAGGGEERHWAMVLYDALHTDDGRPDIGQYFDVVTGGDGLTYTELFGPSFAHTRQLGAVLRALMHEIEPDGYRARIHGWSGDVLVHHRASPNSSAPGTSDGPRLLQQSFGALLALEGEGGRVNVRVAAASIVQMWRRQPEGMRSPVAEKRVLWVLACIHFALRRHKAELEARVLTVARRFRTNLELPAAAPIVVLMPSCGVSDPRDMPAHIAAHPLSAAGTVTLVDERSVTLDPAHLRMADGATVQRRTRRQPYTTPDGIHVIPLRGPVPPAKK